MEKKKLSAHEFFIAKIFFKNKSEILFQTYKTERIYHQQIFCTRNSKESPLERRKIILDGNAVFDS